MSSNFGSNLFPIAAAVVIIVISIGVSAAVVGSPDKAMSQVLTVGPVWTTDSWLCTSDADFIVYGNIRGLAGSLLEIDISEVGSQSLYALDEGQLESFTIGASSGQQIIITKSGTITGFITMQTISDAEANCVPL